MKTSRLGFLRKVRVFLIGGLLPSCLVVFAQAQTAPAGTSAVKAVNISRLLGGATVRSLDSKTGQLVPVSGMTAVIDDDASSGWTPPVGKTLLVVSLADDTDLTSFTLFAPGAKGDYTISTATSLETALNPEQRTEVLKSTFSKDAAQPVPNVAAKFVVVELSITESAPIRSIDVVGRPKGNAANQFTVVVPDSSKEQNAGKADGKLVEVNFAADALGAVVVNAATGKFDTMIDGDTGTATALESRDGQPATASITLAAAVSVDRISLAFEQAKGTVRFMATDAETPGGRIVGEVKLDGTSKTLTLETPGVSAESITVIWTPDDGVSPLVVSEIGAFALARVERTPPAPDGAMRPVVRNESPSVTPPPKPGINVPPPILPPSKPVSG